MSLSKISIVTATMCIALVGCSKPLSGVYSDKRASDEEKFDFRADGKVIYSLEQNLAIGGKSFDVGTDGSGTYTIKDKEIVVNMVVKSHMDAEHSNYEVLLRREGDDLIKISTKWAPVKNPTDTELAMDKKQTRFRLQR